MGVGVTVDPAIRVECKGRGVETMRCGESAVRACRETGNGALIAPIGVRGGEGAFGLNDRRPDDGCGVDGRRRQGDAES